MVYPYPYSFNRLQYNQSPFNDYFCVYFHLFRSPMSYFDTTPLGRILNRFSKDIDIVDVTIPMNLRMLLTQSFNVLGTLFVICFANPLFLTVIVPIVLMYYFLQKFYVATARQVKRMEAISRFVCYTYKQFTVINLYLYICYIKNSYIAISKYK